MMVDFLNLLLYVFSRYKVGRVEQLETSEQAKQRGGGVSGISGPWDRVFVVGCDIIGLRAVAVLRFIL